MTHGYTLFDTAVGRCGLAWSEAGVAAVSLPEGDDAATRARLLKRCPAAQEQAPPPQIARAVEQVVALLEGQPIDFSDVPLDLEAATPFERRVYDLALRIPPGETRTYGAIARELGEPGAAQAVGRALGANPIPIIVPCHRVLGADGKAGGFSAPGGVSTKARMLTIEGARTSDQPTLFDAEISIAPKRR
ncbi:methylated-DNA--[protein]-cysteine S-methyltransferase [Caulobacter sp. 17J65-9]|uniref:methylated-DNA--[protein]-cysteine S-methyltransferase n=1 Tax=Caulobacter sp. 17J65-9 TaxID=2709382 RepID=UPI0013CD4A09|nr:methylated-DNA--[protein]-cysteine S-methyltransferase [Caulobacter sp. 17J65-9]NEX93859.1 methylated-DNA--[protein]-cysteine S-methyltransferase [Caulobacter sp. 17J65-9]